MKRLIRVGSRESSLAMTQTKWVINEIQKMEPNYEFEIIGIKTKGDIILNVKLDKIGGKGLFIKELEQALIENKIDMAVHSLKDLPAEVHEELIISAFSKREDPRDVLISLDGKCLKDLKEGEIVGTSSARREVQLLSIRPDLKIKMLRGNVLTRINKLVNNEYDAIILAAAGLKRLGLEEKCVEFFDVEDMIPAVGQGILAIETRKNEDIRYLINSLHCKEAEIAAKAERAFMIRLNGGCSAPIAAHAVIKGETLKLNGLMATEDKSCIFRAKLEGSIYEAVEMGEKLADMILTQEASK